MREIKFRGVHPISGDVMAVCDISWLHDEVYFENGGDEPYPMNACKLQQYTGLKDKNGVEIYDGDIFFDGLNNCVIEFYELNCAFVANDGCEKHYLGAHISNVEVIGNIHQNPELLDK